MLYREEEKTEKKEKKRGRRVLAVLLTLLVLLAAYAAVGYLTYEPVFETGTGPVFVEAGKEFSPEDAVECALKSSLPIYPDIPFKAETLRSDVDTSKPGDYSVTYGCPIPGKGKEETVAVRVSDWTAPQITLAGGTAGHFTRLSGYTEEGYSAWDEVDGDVTDKVTRTVSADSITYTVCDSAGNTARAVRTLQFEHSKPEFSGQLYTSYLTPSTYADYPGGLTCTDGWGNDISDLIRCRGGTKPVPGTYTLEYYVTDEDGNDITYKVPIEVKMGTLKYDPSKADPNKVIYLTYDDGPSAYTSKLLDILDMYGVKATFFVTGSRPSYYSMIGEEYRRGHKIAAHTFTHDYDIVYASEEAYFDDLDRIEAVIYDQTGEYTKLIRFPGGSSNTVSRFNHGIMTRLVKAVAERGYRYFDWSVSSGDGRSVLTTQEVFERVKKGVSGHSVSIVLQHDTKLWSIEAVPMIIEWGIVNGYTFATLDETSYQAAHHLNN